MNLHADIFIAQEQWASAIVELEAVLAITEEIGDTGLEASARAKMALALLETNQLADAEAHIDAILAIRPPGADVLRLQARVAALHNDPDQAVEHMTAARISAGEAWDEEDEQTLETYREAVAANALP